MRKTEKTEQKSEKTVRNAAFSAQNVRFSSTNQPKNNRAGGRKKKIATVLKELGREVTPETEAQIYRVMLDAISCSSAKDAETRLKQAETDQPEFGWLFEQVITAIKKEGLSAILEVLDRVFGKRSRVDLTSGGQAIAPVALVEFLTKEEGKDEAGSKGRATE